MRGVSGISSFKKKITPTLFLMSGEDECFDERERERESMYENFLEKKIYIYV